MEEIQTFIQKYSKKENRAPTIREISAKIKGVNRSNFYKYFPKGIAEACKAAGVSIPEKRTQVTRKASKARKAGRNAPFPIISLNPESSRKLWVMSTLEDKDPQSLIDDLLEQDRLLRTEYNLNNKDIAQFTQFLKNGEKQGLKNQQVINSMNKLIKLGIERLHSYRFNKLINLVDSMIIQSLKVEDLYNIYLSKNEMYKRGYQSCVDLVKEQIIVELSESRNIDLIEAASISLSITIYLLTNAPLRAPPT